MLQSQQGEAMEQKLVVGANPVYWTFVGDPPTVEEAMAALSANGFSTKYAEPVPKSTAFARVVQAMAGRDKVTGSVFDATFDSKKMIRQIDKLVPDPDNPRKIGREFVAAWQMDKDNGNAIIPVAGSKDISQAVVATTMQYISSDVTSVIQKILKSEGLGAYPLRSAGGIYCVPTTGTADMLERLSKFCNQIGVRLVVLNFHDPDKGKSEVSESIAAGLMTEVAEHKKSIESYDSESTKLGIIDNRRKSIATTREMATKLASLLDGKEVEIIAQLDDLSAKATEIYEKIESAKPVKTGRRLVGAPA